MRAEKSENVGGDERYHITPLFYTHDDDSDDDPDEPDIASDNRPELSLEAAGRKAEGNPVNGHFGRSKVSGRTRSALTHQVNYSSRAARAGADARAAARRRDKNNMDSDIMKLEEAAQIRKQQDAERNQRLKKAEAFMPQDQDLGWAEDDEEAERAPLEAEDAARKKNEDEISRRAVLPTLLCVSSDIEGGPNALLLTQSMVDHAASYAKAHRLNPRYVHGGDSGDIREESLKSLKYLNENLGVIDTKLCGNRDANVVRFNELFLPPGKTLVPFTPDASNQIKNFYADVLQMDKDLGNDYTMTSHRANCRQLILIYGWHRLSRGTINPTFNSSTHIDVANSHFSEFTELDKKPDNELVGTEGLSDARSLIDLLTAFVSLYKNTTETETHLVKLKALFDDIVKRPGVKLLIAGYLENAKEWARELAKYVQSSDALSHSYVGGDQVLGVHDFFGPDGGRVGQVFKDAASIGSGDELYETYMPQPNTPKEWVDAANTRHRQLVDNSQALQAIANKQPAQESRTPAQDKLLARLADPQSNGFFHGERPMNYVHTLCESL